MKKNMPATALVYKAMELAHMKAAALACNMPAAAFTNETVSLVSQLFMQNRTLNCNKRNRMAIHGEL